MNQPGKHPSAALEWIAARSQQAFFVFDLREQTFVYVSPSFEALFGRKLPEINANPQALLAVVHADDREYVKQTYWSVLRGEQNKNIECRIVVPGRNERWVGISPLLGNDPDNENYLAGLVEDVSDKKDLELTLRKFAAKKNAVLEILAHDLAGPLGTIQGLSSLLGTRTQQYQNQDLTEITQLIEKTCRRSIHLIREFVKNEFMASADAALVRERVDLVVKIQEVIEQYKDSQDVIAKRFTLTHSAAQIYVPLDEVKFMQVINNLISNAIKFTADDGEIAIHLEEQPESILVTVRDNGIGIPLHLQEGLFERFTKARRPGLRGEESTGLGMSIIKTIVEWHRGKIWFQSRENQGSTFFIQLPKE